MGSFEETYNKHSKDILSELAPAALAPALPVAKTAAARGLAALAGGLATLMSNQQTSKPTKTTQQKKADPGLIKTGSKALPEVGDSIVKSKFDEYYKHVASNLISEIGPLAIPAAMMAGSALKTGLAGLAGTGALIGLGATAADALKASQTTASPAPPTSTSTPTIGATPTSTVSPPAVATPTSTTTPTTDVISTGTAGTGAGALSPAATVAGTAALAVPLSRSVARTRNQARPTPTGLMPTGSKALPGVEDSIIQNKFYI